MRVLFVNATEARGGAARAMGRIARAVQAAGAEVELLVGERAGRLPLPVRRARRRGCGDLAGKLIERAALLGSPRRRALLSRLGFSPAWRTRDVVEEINAARPDLVHLHWVNYGLLSPEGIAAIEAPVVWTLHDMWPFTGGCHYAQGCEGWRDACGRCPALASDDTGDLSRAQWTRKRAAYARPLQLVAPSRWLAGCAGDSALLGGQPVRVIPNPTDLDAFSPGDKLEARARLRLPPAAPLVLFGGDRAMETAVKGYPALDAALHRLAAHGGETPHLAVFGSQASARRRVTAPVPVHMLGVLTEEADLVAAYRAADLLAAPSLQDNLPGTACEALACGTPVVGFAVGGLPDLVTPGVNGALAPTGDADALAEALASVLARRADPTLSAAARRSAERLFSPAVVGAAYLQTYRDALELERSRRCA